MTACHPSSPPPSRPRAPPPRSCAVTTSRNLAVTIKARQDAGDGGRRRDREGHPGHHHGALPRSRLLRRGDRPERARRGVPVAGGPDRRHQVWFVREYPMFSTRIALMHRGQPRWWAVRCRAGVRRGRLREFFATRACSRPLLDRIDGTSIHADRGRRSPRGNLEDARRRAALAGVGRASAAARTNRIRGTAILLHYHLLAAGSIDAVARWPERSSTPRPGGAPPAR